MGKGFYISKTLGIVGIVIGAGAVATIIALSVVYSQEKSKNNEIENQQTTTTKGPTTNVPATTNVPTTAPSNEPWDQWRLPQTLSPETYKVTLWPRLQKNPEGLYIFTGESSVVFRCVENTDLILIHSNKLTIKDSTTLKALGGNPAPNIVSTKMHPKTQYMAIWLDRELTAGESYELYTEFVGELSDDLGGFYRSEYYDENGVLKVVATTQMQATDARKAFPCFDEPAMKAVFNIVLLHDPGTVALSNGVVIEEIPVTMDGISLTKTTFAPTEKMSTYLLAFIVSEFTYIEQKLDDLQIRIFARKEAIDANQGEYALNVTGKILRFFEEYYNSSYPLPKSDQIALPDFNAGAMENWGLITYRETALLYDEEMSSNGNKERVVTVIAHELAHQWFGNLVTIRWWNDLWLNEGFASYVEYLGADKAEPLWNIKDLIVLNDVHRVFAIDALASSHPLSSKEEDVQRPEQISEVFDTISYSKGASVLRMLSNFLSEDVFTQGLRTYLEHFKFNNTVYTDLWDHLQMAVDETGTELPRSVKDIMDRWVLQMGFPVVTINTVTGQISQEHFLLDPETKPEPSEFNYEWFVPITWTKNEAIKPQYWLLQKNTQFDDMKTNANEWVLANINMVGYYRVNYDEQNWERLLNALQTSRESIPVMKLLFLSAVLLSSALLTLCDPLYVLMAPNLLRVGSSENVFVEAQDYSGEPLRVKISVKNFPAKNVEMMQKTVTLTGEKYQILTDIEIPDDKNFFSDDEKKQYVYLQAHFPSVTLEKVVMVSFQSGYLFVQTDKPIYTPGSNVQYRIFSMTPNLKPLSQPGITVDIMNPQGITVASDAIKAEKGVKSSIYNIPDVTSLGMWKVVTRYTNTPLKTFTAEFEVKEYVLPTFEVKLTPSSFFYYVGDNKQENDEEDSLTVDIEAKYLFGKKMDGNAFVVFGVMDGAAKTSIVNSLQKVPVVNGVGTAELTREMITKTFKNIKDLVGKSIYVSVNLLTESGSEMVEAEKRGIQIVTSPYTIHYKRTSQFFKPGMPLGVSVYVTNPDETPAKDVEVEVLVDGKGGVSGKTRDNGIVKVKVNTPGGASTLKITAKTKNTEYTSEQQAVKTMTAQAYKTKHDSKNYLHINIESAEFEIGDQMTVNLITGQSSGDRDQDYTYMILSKGQIVLAERFKRQGQTLVTLSLTITKEMVPSFRFVAYYHVGKDEVVSDSVWVDVKDTCMGKLNVEVKEKKNTYETGNDVNLHITGDPGARVGLVVVDKAVQVLNKNRLTQTKVWDVIEKHDTGCTGGGGKDSMGVFSDAGLIFESNTAGGTDTRTVPECPAPLKRKRRSESLQTITTTLAGQYTEKIRPCCYDGMRNNRIGYTCERRASYVIDGEECVKAFLHCCKEVKNHKEKETEEEELILARSDEDEEGDYKDYDDITSRTQFPESWLWEEFDLCDKCSKPSKDKVIYLKDSITTWQILAISLSPTHGICVAEPEEIVVFKSFFIDLKVPYSAVRGEQVEIKAIIHNYTPKHLKKVRVEFLETAGVCSAASKKGKYRTTVNVDKDSSVAVSFVIVPMTLESQHIEVKASISDYEDGVRKTLKVVSEGVLTKFRTEKLELNPGKKGEKPLVLRSGIPADQVPGTPVNSYITVTGEEISQSIEQAINGSFMGELIIQPHGCGEQNMVTMTLPFIATHYLDNTNQWEYVGIDRRKVAINHIKTGYEGQLKFRKQDGSYALWIETESSTWLTAYVAKVFAMASKLIAIEENVICSALKWLVMHKQLPDGSFKEDKPVYHREIMGGIEGQNTDVSLTAFVLIAMQEGKEICGGAVGSLHESIRKSVAFLKNQLTKLTNPYAAALTSYALANADSLDKEILMKHSTKGNDGRFWNVPGWHYHSIEATAYAVLALVKAKDYDTAGEAVHWLAKQKSSHGGYDTTQVTIMVFQAVAEYRAQVQDLKNFDLNVELVVPGRRKTDRWTIQRSNVHLTRSGSVDMNKDFTVIAKGTGSAILSVLTLYYARPFEKKTDCAFFDLSVKLDKIPETKPGTNGTYNFILDFFYKNKTNDATMTILDIGLPTGFDIDEADLKQLSTGKERYIQKYEKNKVLSERGSLIIYLNKVSHKESETLVFRMHKTFNVGLLQPASVTIYEYYSPDARCKKYYHPEREDSALYRLCKGDLCVCAEENCSYQKKNHVNESERLIKACEPHLDYIYKAKLVKMDLKKDSDIYHMKVEKTVKEGTDPDVQGKVKPFLARPSCRVSLGLVEGKSYLIMGNSVDLPTLGGSLQYIIGEQTWIEYWPTSDESKSAEHRDRYIGMTAVENMFTTGGCLT